MLPGGTTRTEKQLYRAGRDPTYVEATKARKKVEHLGAITQSGPGFQSWTCAVEAVMKLKLLTPGTGAPKVGHVDVVQLRANRLFHRDEGHDRHSCHRNDHGPPHSLYTEKGSQWPCGT